MRACEAEFGEIDVDSPLGLRNRELGVSRFKLDEKIPGNDLIADIMKNPRPATDEPTAVSPADSGAKPAAKAARRDDRPKSIDATRRSSL